MAARESVPDPEDIAIGERLKSVMEGLTDPQAAGIAGCSVNTYRRWIKGTYAADAKALGRVARARGVSIEWLLSGEPEDPRSAAIGTFKAGVERALSPVIGRRVNVAPPKANDDEYISIPVHDVQISAGSGLAAIEEGRSSTQWNFPRAWLQERFGDISGLRLAPVVGDSMEPDLRDGDRLLFNVHKRALSDGIHVVRIDDALMVKRVQVQGATVRLLSTNPVYAPIVIDLAAEAHRFAVIGKAEWTGKMMS